MAGVSTSVYEFDSVIRGHCVFIKLYVLTSPYRWNTASMDKHDKYIVENQL